MRTIFTIICGQPSTFISFIAWLVFSVLLLFILDSYQLLANVLNGDFPLWLFVSILPTLLLNFLVTSSPLVLFHRILISILLSVYLTLLTYVFVHKRYFSFSSFSVSIAALFGITLGITCLSCTALAGIILVSTLGSFAVVPFLLHHESLFLIAGELLLLISIGALVVVVRRFER